MRIAASLLLLGICVFLLGYTAPHVPHVLSIALLGIVLLLFIPWRRRGIGLDEDHLSILHRPFERPRRIPYAHIRRAELLWHDEHIGHLHLTLRGEPPEEIVVPVGGPFTDLEKKTVAWIQARAATAVFE